MPLVQLYVPPACGDGDHNAAVPAEPLPALTLCSASLAKCWPKAVVKTRPVSCQSSPASRRSAACAALSLPERPNCQLRQFKVRRDFGAFVWPPARSERDTATNPGEVVKVGGYVSSPRRPAPAPRSAPCYGFAHDGAFSTQGLLSHLAMTAERAMVPFNCGLRPWPYTWRRWPAVYTLAWELAPTPARRRTASTPARARPRKRPPRSVRPPPRPRGPPQDPSLDASPHPGRCSRQSRPIRPWPCAGAGRSGRQQRPSSACRLPRYRRGASRPGGQPGRGAEPGHVPARLGDDHLRGAPDARDRHQTATCRSNGAPSRRPAGPGQRPSRRGGRRRPGAAGASGRARRWAGRRRPLQSSVAQLLIPIGSAPLGSEVVQVPDRLEGGDVAGLLPGIGWCIN